MKIVGLAFAASGPMAIKDTTKFRIDRISHLLVNGHEAAGDASDGCTTCVVSPPFGEISFCCCRLSLVQDRLESFPVNIIGNRWSDKDVRFGSKAASQIRSNIIT